MRTKPLDIAVALTRPHRGAITLIKDKGIIGNINISIFNHEAGDKNRVAHFAFDESIVALAKEKNTL